MSNYDKIEGSEADTETAHSSLKKEEISTMEEISTRWKIATFIMMNLSLFVSYGLFSLPGSFLPLYNLDRNINLDTTGIILGAVPLCYIFVCPLVSKLLDRWSSKCLLLVSTGLVSMITLLFATMGYIVNNTTYIAVSLLLRLLQGMTGGVIDVVAFAVTAKMFPSNIALTTSIVESTLNMAIATSPYIGAVLYENVSFLIAFVVPAGAIFIVFLLNIVAVKDVSCRRDGTESCTRTIMTDFLIMFPSWHCAFSQTLLNFYIPILAAYTEVEFGKGAIFAGLCLLINTAGIIISSPFLGQLMDTFNPYFFFILSAFLLPVTYLFLGPSPCLQTVITPSPTQLIVVLALIGFIMPMACYPSLIIMYDIYKVRYRMMSQSAQNLITSLYCTSFPLGAFLGVTSAGIISQYLTFAESTMMMGWIAVAESLLLLVYCFFVRRLKEQVRNSEETRPILSGVVDMEITS